MKTIHLDGEWFGRPVDAELRRGKSIFEALAIAAWEAQELEERQKRAITGAWVDEADMMPPK